MSPVVEDRLALLDTLTIKSGGHGESEQQFCVMEAVAYIAGEPWSDRPQCACPVIAAFLRNWNDRIRDDEERTRLLKPLIVKLVGTKATKDVERRRVVMLVDWSIRESLPAWLDLTPALKPHADTLRALKPFESLDDVKAARPLVVAARDAAWAVRSEALGALRAKRGAAAAAAAAAAADAYADAAAAAAAAAAADADADAAAYAAAYAALKSKKEQMQLSAVALVERLCEVK